MQDKPLLFVDIDGVISLWGFDSNARPAGAFHNVDGVIHFLSSDAGIHLLALAAGASTSSGAAAGRRRPMSICRTRSPYPAGCRFSPSPRNPGRAHAHWKLAAIDAHAGPRRPLAWIDDAHDAACRAWAAARGAPTLLVTTTPAVGLSAVHVDELNGWAADVARAR